MNEPKKTKRAYFKPEAELIFIGCDAHILQASVSGGHHDAEDDPEVLDAKQGFFDDEADAWQMWGE